MTPRSLRLAAILALCLAPGLLPAQEPAPAPAPTPSPAAAAAAPSPAAPDEEDENPFAADPHKLRQIPAARAQQKWPQLRLRLETWEASALDALRWQDEATGKDSIAKLRDDLVAGKRPGRLVYSPSLLLEQGAKPTTEAIAEWIYPTEYVPPGLPAKLAKTDPSKPVPQDFVKQWSETAGTGKLAYPTSFETRNTGQTLEARVQSVTVEAGSWDVSLSFEDVMTLGKLQYGDAEAHVEMPLFASFRSGSVVRLKEGQWRLFSVMEPPRGLDGKPTDKRWLTLLRIDPQS